jgi:hypothetical protein
MFLKEYSRSLLLELQIQARDSSVAYINQHMRGLPFYKRPGEILHHALDQERVPGLVLEFGVAGGATIRTIAKKTEGPVHGFDSFEGLPEAWAGNRRGRFAPRDGTPKLPTVPPQVQLHVGWFDQTLPKFLETTDEPVSFLHVDCDLYSSTRTILELLGDRIQPGTIIVFDEYFNFPHWQEHEYKAFQEFVREKKVRYRYLCFSVTRNQVAAVIEGIDRP